MRHAVQVEVIRELLAQLDAGVNADAGGIMEVPASTYTCPDMAAREWATFFRGQPQILGMSGDLPEPGSFITSSELGLPILVTRDTSGVVRAFLNSCRHRGPMVETERRGRRTRFSCPFHGWTYGSAGDLIGIPEEAQFGAVDKSCLGLVELPALEAYGFVLVHPDPKGVIDPVRVFQGVADDLEHWNWGRYVLVAEQVVDMKLNWKLATDTFGETYHFKRLHKNTLANNFHGDVLSYRTYERNHRMVLCMKGIDGLRGRPEEEWRIAGSGFPVYFLFPNVEVNVGDGRVVLVRVYPDPKDPGRSVSHFSYYFDPDTLAAAPPEATAMFTQGFTGIVVAEDYATGETTQAALSAGLQDTLLFGRNEPPLHHYHRTFRRELGLEPPVVRP